MIKNWYFNWDSKIFGITTGGAHLRVVNTLIVLFCAAGLANLLIDGFDVFQAFLFLPFLIVFMPVTRQWLTGEWTYEDLDWEQQLQFLKKQMNSAQEVDLAEFQRLQTKFEEKYQVDEKFVESWRIIFPFLIILITLIIFGFTGEYDAAYDRYSRFF